MGTGATEREVLEKKLEKRLQDPKTEPLVSLPLYFLKDITSGFSTERELGRGVCGIVYKGVLRSGKTIAVKKIFDTYLRDNDNRVKNEIICLTEVRHQNVVQLVGYCVEAKSEVMEYGGKHVMVDKHECLLCFEFLYNGSLDKHLSDEISGFDWGRRYEIIRGLCRGLHYLHDKCRIVHWDLKPQNILMDETMMPKIADFVLSRLLSQGTPGYMAPERSIFFEADIFSLGVIIIEIITGHRDYPSIGERNGTSLKQYTEKVVGNWRNRIMEITPMHVFPEMHIHLVEQCISIALKCLEPESNKRPTSLDIIQSLNAEELSSDVEKVVRQKSLELYVLGNSTSRMDDICNGLRVLEYTIEGSEKPSNLKLPLLKHITNNFSDDLKIGHGGCGVVYKGILPNGTVVAVKKLSNSHTIDDKMFHQEVKSMMVVQHQNVVRFLGYCSHTEEQAVEMAGIINMAQIRERLLCLEYISNGSLQNRITDELRGLEWHTRYQIIKGICEGLLHLHMEKHIIHMDLKPANILLDDHLMPKITDFGLSRLDEKSQTISKERLRSLGYCAPEYQFHGKMSAKSDIYSLGVIIIELLTGSKETPSITKVMVLRRWSHRWNKSMSHTPLWYQQVIKCLDLALRCKHTDPIERPYIWDVICELNKMDSIGVPACGQMIPCLEDMLRIEPLDIQLPFEVNKELSCSIELINNTDDYIAFRISTISLRQYHIHPSCKDIVPPRSRCSATIALQPQKWAPPHHYCQDEFSVQSTSVDASLKAMDITGDTFNDETGKLVDNVNIIVVLDVPP